jgi:Rieske Fe-S protein
MMDRREFVQRCVSASAVASGSLILTGCASLAVRNVTPVNGRIHLALNRYPELTEAGGSLRVQADGMREPIYVLAQADGGFTAISPICTHLGCTVEIERDRLVCPCHGSTYDRAGSVLKGPAERSLSHYRTRLADGVLVIELRESS